VRGPPTNRYGGATGSRSGLWAGSTRPVDSGLAHDPFLPIDTFERVEGCPAVRGTTSPVRVLIVDDQAVFRDAARAVVAATEGFAFAGEAICGQTALDAIPVVRAQLVLMDVRMPGMGGIEAARIIEERHPDAVVVLLSAAVPSELSRPAGRKHVIVDKRTLSPDLLRTAWDSAQADGFTAP
jgi:two-component system invasion response regulator UvrY